MTAGEAAAPRWQALAPCAALAVATALEIWVATAAGGDRATRVTALVGLLTAKASVLVSWLMGARLHRRVAALTIGAMGLAVGFAVVLMLEAAFRARVR
jgi:Na+-translocating ferredoxin:NAD+ oxidoreductase RnfA subunit